jgi:CRISPR-associated protein Cas2
VIWSGSARRTYRRQVPLVARNAEDEPMESWLVCYDISDPKRLRKVATACEDYGTRRQLSVFLMRLSRTEFVRLRTRLHDLIHHREDQVLFIPLCGTCVNKIEAIGRPTEAHDARDVVLVL